MVALGSSQVHTDGDRQGPFEMQEAGKNWGTLVTVHNERSGATGRQGPLLTEASEGE